MLPIRVMTMRLPVSSPRMSGPEPAGGRTGPGELVTVGLDTLADLLLTWAAGPLPALADADEQWGRRLRAERLAAVSG